MVGNSFCRFGVPLLTTCFSIGFANPLLVSISHAQRVATTTSERAREAQRVTVSMDNAPLGMVIHAIARQAGLVLAFDDAILPANKRVTLRVRDMQVNAAFEQVLHGTGLIAHVRDAGDVTIIRGVIATQANGVIAGKVIDAKTKQSLRGAKVGLDGNDRVTETNDDGTYRLANVSAGAHTLVVKLVGYTKLVRSIMVQEGGITPLDVALDPTAIALDQVVVTGTIIPTELRAVPNAMTVITAKQIEERGITKIDQLFRGDVPGVFALNKGSNALLDEVTMFSRGATALVDESSGRSVSVGVDQTTGNTNPIKTYIDGIEMADPKYLSQIDPKSIERIEILTGPQASTIYGANAINGVMQIFTKRGTSSKPQLTIALTSGVAENNVNSRLAPSHDANTSVSGIEGRWSYAASGSWNYTGAWTPGKQTQRLSMNGGGRMNIGSSSADISARQGLTKNKHNGDELQGLSVLRTTGVWTPSATLTRQPLTQTLSGQTAGVSFSSHPVTWGSYNVGVGQDASTTETLKPTGFYASRADTTPVISSSTTSRVSEKYATTVQIPLLSIARLNLAAGGDHWRTAGLSWTATPRSLTGALTPVTSLVRTKPSKNTGAYVQGQLGVQDALFFTYGVRADWNPNYGDKAKVRPGRYGVAFSRDIGLVSVKLRGSYGRSIRPPADALKQAIPEPLPGQIALFGNYDLQLANPNLGPEVQQGGEGGLELYLGSRASIVVTRYNQTVDNLILPVFPVDSVRSLMVPPDPYLCGTNSNGGTTFDADGNCFEYQSEYLNAGSLRNQGWELQGSVNLGPFATGGTYSWTKSRVIGVTQRYSALSTDIGFQRGRPFDFIPEHTWAVNATYTRASSTITLSIDGTSSIYKGFNIYGDPLSLAANAAVRLQSSRPRMVLPVGYRTVGPGYAMANLNAMHRFSSSMEVTLHVTNLTDYYQNDISSEFASMGRQTQLGLRVRF